MREKEEEEKRKRDGRKERTKIVKDTRVNRARCGDNADPSPLPAGSARELERRAKISVKAQVSTSINPTTAETEY